ncbi:MAG: CPBP family intramembrane metalloprotease [Acidipropionibacterium jensenii]|uniref:CPBP family intramembrane glutamic endopeptidase n=1 Tax=Acidipropionibacterium jensenii TaxID=1749 RepID=UPI00264878D5|nr:type II CAAX endopeptidase family protein [Acidipropionibacterium jensenii]MDN5978073.1 CPBP family intramembrane metalloprotease [Acidipropionibacterium jensenii]
MRDPQPRVDYSQVLVEPGEGRLAGAFGIAGGLLGYALVVPLVLQALLLAGWLAGGRSRSFSDYAHRAQGFETIWGLTATHLALACLIPVALLLARYLHHRAPRWVWSVQPGLRARFLVWVMLVAVIVLNLTQILARGDGHLDFQVPHLWWLWLLAILLTSPLQAAAEEVFFRGYLLNCFGSLGANKWVAVIASALVFALFHGTQNLWLFLDRLSFGLAAGALVILTGGLEAGIAAHVVNNLFAFGYAVFLGGAAQARGITSMGVVDALWDVGGFVGVAMAAWWIGRLMRVARLTPGPTGGDLRSTRRG